MALSKQDPFPAGTGNRCIRLDMAWATAAAAKADRRGHPIDGAIRAA